MEILSSKRKPNSISPKPLNHNPLITKKLKSSLRPQSKDEAVLDEKINEKIIELKTKLKTLIQKDMYYINNMNDIKNTENYLKYINAHLEIEASKDETEISALTYYTMENKKTNELLEKLKMLSNNDEWLDIRKVITEIQSLDTDNIYKTVYNILIEENKRKILTERSTIKGHYLYFLMNKNNHNKKDEITEALNLINNYKIINPRSFDLIEKEINNSKKKIPSRETLNKHNSALHRQTSPKTHLSKKINFSTFCKKDSDCKDLNKKCIQNLCSVMERIEQSDKYKARVDMVLQGKPLIEYPTKRTQQQRDGFNKLIRRI